MPALQYLCSTVNTVAPDAVLSPPGQPRHPIGALQVRFEISKTIFKFLAMTGAYGKNFTLLPKKLKIRLALFIIFRPYYRP
jgi:hypothetical protein